MSQPSATNWESGNHRHLALLFIDVVDSTGHLDRLGDGLLIRSGMDSSEDNP